MGERLYSPEQNQQKVEIKKEQFEELERISRITGMEITVLVDAAIRHFASAIKKTDKYQALEKQQAYFEYEFGLDTRWEREIDFPDPYDIYDDGRFYESRHD